METDDYKTYCGNHFIRYMNVESLCCTPETNIILYINYNFKKRKSVDCKVRFYIWNLNSVPLIYMSNLLPVLHSFDYCGFAVSFEIGKYESSNLVLFQDCFGYSGSLAFPYKFLKPFCQMSAKKTNRPLRF